MFASPVMYVVVMFLTIASLSVSVCVEPQGIAHTSGMLLTYAAHGVHTQQGGGSRLGAPTLCCDAQPSASRAFCSSGVSLAMPMPVAAHTRAKKMAIQLEIAQGR